MKLTESYWPATHEIELLDTTCGQALEHAAAAAPDTVALVEGISDAARCRRWTYATLLSAAERTARALLARFAPGDHVALWAQNCPEWIIVQFALALAGMVMVTVNPAYRASELRYVLKQSRAKGCFYQRSYRGMAMGPIVHAIADELGSLGHLVCLDELEEFVSSGNAATALPRVRPGDAAMIQYTSGTTGMAKGAQLSHYGVTNNSRMMALLREGRRGTVNLAVAPLFHTGGCVAGVLGTVQTQGTYVLMPEFDAQAMLDLIEQERAAYTFAVPTMLIALLAAHARRPRDLSSLETVFSGATIVPIDLVHRVEAAFGVRLTIGFGQTETSPAITNTRLDDSARDKSESIGRALPHVEVKIIDPATAQTLPVNRAGELCTRGFLTMMGYFDMPEATARTIDRDGWLHTGDLCSMDERGYCFVTGRLKDMIIRGGENIYPREIEEALYTHPDVAEVAVFGVPDDYWGEAVAAAVTLRSGAQVSGESLREFVRQHLARHKAPVCWFAMHEIPKTASGKMQKFKLVEMYRSGALESARI